MTKRIEILAAVAHLDFSFEKGLRVCVLPSFVSSLNLHTTLICLHCEFFKPGIIRQSWRHMEETRSRSRLRAVGTYRGS